jgi:hypothetical protein
MGMNPDYWGPYFWAVIHLVCLGAPSQFDADDQIGYKQFFSSLPSVLPCPACAMHLQQNLQTLPIEQGLAEGNKSLFRWSVDLHNTVNKQNEKPEMSYEDALKLWSDVALGEEKPFWKIIDVVSDENKSINGSLPTRVLYVFIFILIGFVLGLLFMYLSRTMRNSRRTLRQ